ncbi:MAG: HAMP domain-containing sensor histidine kinase [Chthoniobacteraceae bacterium]
MTLSNRLHSLFWNGNAPAVVDAVPEATEVFCARIQSQRLRTDRVLAGLLLFQWAVACAMSWPRGWNMGGGALALHAVQGWGVVVLGAILALIPIFSVWLRPGTPLTRRTVAIGQMLFAGLLLHLSGGRPELQFHAFCSLAILAFYLDASVLTIAAAVVTLDHALRGSVWPESIYGSAPVQWWRWIERGGWYFMEAGILSRFIEQYRAGTLELAGHASRQLNLSRQVAQREQAAQELDVLNKQLIESSREAGMAEIATSVLHNVGNVLNSVNVSGMVISDRARRSKAGELGKLAALLKEQQPRLVEFLTTDPRGKLVPDLIAHFADALLVEQGELIAEAEGLSKNVTHIRDIVAMQQTYATSSVMSESVDVGALIDDALRINASELERHGVEVFRDIGNLPPIFADKPKALQILVNLITNARQAIVEQGGDKKLLTLKACCHGDESVRIVVRDNGVGVPYENLTRIFSHGFTTKRGGHGFGLHSGALAAKEMGGSLTAQSDGPGRGATFTLELPIAGDGCVQAAA